MTIHPATHSALWPLDDMPSQLIAGETLAFYQQEFAQQVDGAHFMENAWITPADWQLLANNDGPTILKSTLGTKLAWIGDISEDTEEVTASHDSFLIRFPWEYIQINEQLVSALSDNQILGEVSPAAHIDGVIYVGKGSKILPGVVIEGNIVIGENCKVGPNCYLRGSTTIGDNCHIGQAVEIKNSIIGHGSSIGHLSYVGDSVIGTKVNFGAGTITSNLRHDGTNHRSMVQGTLTDTGRRKFGCVVGNNVHTGINTSIYPGRKLGCNSSTLPGDIVKTDISSETF